MADDSVHTPAQPAHGTTEMLIDRYLPGFDATIIEHVVVNADIPTAWRALCDLDLMRVHTPLLDAAFFVRGVPIRLAGLLGRGTQHPEAPPQLKLSADSVGLEGWLQLGEQPEREIAIGAVDRFWQPNIEWHDVATMTPEQFGGFDEPGWGRIAANWSLRPYGTTRTLALPGLGTLELGGYRYVMLMLGLVFFISLFALYRVEALLAARSRAARDT